MNNKSRITIAIMSAIFIFSLLSLYRDRDSYTSPFNILLSLFSAACVAATIARYFFNRGTQSTCNHEAKLSLPTGWQFFKFLAAFFLSYIVLFSFVASSSEFGIIIYFFYGLLAVPVVIAAGLFTFWILAYTETEKGRKRQKDEFENQ